MTSTSGDDCPSEESLREFLSGNVDESEIERIAGHISGCTSCGDRMDSIDETLFAASSLPTDPESDFLQREVAKILSPTDETGFIGRIGEYPVREVVARGGMGIVFRAWDSKLQREVAIKTLASGLWFDPKARERFLNEARAAARLDHPNILAIYAVESEANPPYIAMAFYEGETLAQHLENHGPLPAKEIVRIGLGVAAGLAEAHRNGLVHRDIKPANIILSNGDIKIADFGLAQGAGSPRLTQTGAIVGTPTFMAPEQFEDENIDHRADLFSLGGLLACMTTGAPPFDGESPVTVMKKITMDPPEISAPENAPQWLLDLIHGLLEKNPEERIAGAEEVIRRLKELSRDAAETRRETRWRPLVTGLGIGAIALVSLAVFLVTRSPRDPLNPEIPPMASSHVFQVKETGEGYPDLKEAIEAAPAGSTVAIHSDGAIIIPDSLTIDKPLRLQAVPGTKPVLVLGRASRSRSFFKTTAPTVWEGITLRCERPKTSIILLASSAPLHVAHCRFDRTDEVAIERKNAVVSVNHPFVIRDSVILSPLSAAVGCTNANGPDEISLNMENCQICAFTGFVFYSPSNTKVWRISLARCSIMAYCAFAGTGGFLTRNNTTFTSDRCAYDLLKTLVWVHSANDLNRFRWTGDRNVYHVRGVFLMQSPGLPSKNRRRVVGTLTDWKDYNSDTRNAAFAELDFLEQAKQIRETGSGYLTVPEEVTAQHPGVGADPRNVGPGIPYTNWTKSADYRVWLRRSNAMLRDTK